MYYLLSMGIGALIAVMILANGDLTALTGAYTASVIIHLVGLVTVGIFCLVTRARVIPREKTPWYVFLGGVIGVATTIFNNVAFSFIGVSAILALGLFGQSVAALVIDSFGLFGSAKRAFHPAKLLGLLLVLAGILCILTF